MKLFWIAAISLGAVTFGSCQTTSSSNSNQADSNASAITGSDVVAELSKSVNVKNVKPGDVVKATVTQDLLAHGRIVIRRGSRLVGHVTEVKPRSKEDQESRLGLVFDKALLKGGGEIDFTAAVRALAPAVRVGAVDKPDEMGAPLHGPLIQSNTPQPVSNSGVGSGKASSSTMGSTTTAPSSKDAASATATSPGLYSTPSHYGNAETDLMGAGSRGVFGLPDLKLNRDQHGGQGSVITSTRHNVKLDSGTQMILHIGSPAQPAN